MNTFFYLEINIIGFLILLIICISQRGFQTTTLQQKIFNQLVYIMMVMMIVDSLVWIIDGKDFKYNIIINYIISTMYYIISAIIPLLWYIYVEAYLNKYNNFFSIKRIKLFVPFIISILIVIVNLKYHFIFYIDENNNYNRGEWILLISIFICNYIFISIKLIFRKLKKIVMRSEKKECIYMLICVILPIAGTILQFVFYEISVIWIGVVISLLLLFINFQNAQISTDTLTGVNNRHQFDRYLMKIYGDVEHKNRYALIMIDIDNFKNINDTYGHILGDKAIIYVANILDRVCEKTDSFLARYGGDEFVIICKEYMVESIEKIVDIEIADFNKSKREKFRLSFSMGYAFFADENIHSVDELTALADENMYQNKMKKKAKNHQRMCTLQSNK